jgi:hypothetical protein
MLVFYFNADVKMKIVTYNTYNPEIEIIEAYGDFAGRGATALEEFLYK